MIAINIIQYIHAHPQNFIENAIKLLLLYLPEMVFIVMFALTINFIPGLFKTHTDNGYKIAALILFPTIIFYVLKYAGLEDRISFLIASSLMIPFFMLFYEIKNRSTALRISLSIVIAILLEMLLYEVFIIDLTDSSIIEKFLGRHYESFTFRLLENSVYSVCKLILEAIVIFACLYMKLKSKKTREINSPRAL